ncbi:MAG TPA: bi-domain-containing oxidoreductase [Bacteroidia bacterium]|nr:bi-domain-containing oxidoreductase [Bacteroidia bacterium]HMU18238.1 bi-domain-containing oxidoreductase [Bacteroidia bacterium]
MEQLTQNLKDGKMQLLEVPFPVLSSGQVLVRNHYSLISAGTEGKTVKDARLSYIGKARARKEEVKKVIDAAKTFGILNTYKMVMNKLDAPSSLGYSTAGEIIAVAPDVTEFRVGDLVACGGNSAVHAEVIAVPVNLCVKLNDKIALQHACFTTLGAIALQGIRQADLRLGENCAVIGLGLVGQLTVQMLKAGGIKTIGIDIDQRMVDLALHTDIDAAFTRNSEDLESSINNITNGYGTDAVIITAGTDSLDPVDLAGALCRKKGKVVIVGAVPTGFKRPNYFKKELDLRMSCSYGPGRYDTEYEEGGIDYPYGYVRWTENRNMAAFVDLIATGKINLTNLLTHTFDFKEAPAAYDLIMNKTEPFVGMILKYDINKPLQQKINLSNPSYTQSDVVAGMIGAGSFGQNFLLPALKNTPAKLSGIVTARPNNARNIADKNQFAFASGNAQDIFSNKDINTVFIATRHETHAGYVMQALQSGKNVFVEKPLCLTEEELVQIQHEFTKHNCRVMVGFNRRFAPMIQTIKKTFSSSNPIAINYRINAGVIPADHWVHDLKVGGGRIVGEACHFIDLCMFIAGSKLTTISAVALNDAQKLNDTVCFNLQFENGSTASVSYFSNGNKSINKEYLEVFGSGIVAVLDDFKTLTVSGKSEKKYNGNQDKGHQNEVKAFVESILQGKPAPIPFEETVLSTLATFRALQSIASNGERIIL